MDKNFKGTEEEYVEFRRKRNEANRRYFSKPGVRLKKNKYSKKYRIENKEKISEYGKKIRKRPEYKKRMKRWAEENIEHVREYRSRPEYKIKKALADKKYNRENRKSINKSHRKWRKNNIEVVKNYNKKYYTSPKGIINYTHHNHKRIALIKERPCDLSNEKIKRILDRDKVCVYCGNDKRLELDHIIPLKLGGNSLYNNFVVACKKCNCSKSGRDVVAWCKLMNREVPKIVLELLEKQKLKKVI